MTVSRDDNRENERIRRFYEKSADKYDRRIGLWDRVLDFPDGRQWVCSQATGDVLEIGVGTGLNLPHYRRDVRVTGIELSPAMVALARSRAKALDRDAQLQVGDAQALEFADESFDTVVITLSLCTIPDDRRALEEAHRVLRPAGRLLLLEHVRSPLRPVRTGQRLLEPLTVRFETDHLLRDPVDHLSEAGFEIEKLERSKWGIVERVAARKQTKPAAETPAS
jgi:ubiquinone/menaquinone biosynthesis C-methylase UbiE